MLRAAERTPPALFSVSSSRTTLLARSRDSSTCSKAVADNATKLREAGDLERHLAVLVERVATSEPNLFTEEIGNLQLIGQAHRVLRVALALFCRGLYLACASLLGVVSEGAWYVDGERLGTPAIRRAIEQDTRAARLHQLVANTSEA